LKSELNEKSPYLEIIKREKDNLDKKEKELNSQKEKIREYEEELPYFEFWVEAFGDNGIRKFIIDGIIPSLNLKVNYWLQFLIDNKIELNFDNQLEETITKNPPEGSSLAYYALSGGERRRVNLAVSQSFAHIMMLNSGVLPSIVFLDEISTNIDQIGIEGLYNMILELSKSRQVFITTHDRDLLEMLSGCDYVNLIKKDGFTKLSI
jgi:DNA repair exonuclease SbcCD ATPase subunit